ncbi:MAG: hypothetical protein M1338_00915 [Patescibacteria group bacterium]|nr:hypothetical protein [Patescibacteria group bacterium]
MYYYILEQPKNLSTTSAQKKLRKILGTLGIEGEVGVVSPARSIEEHTEMAMVKKYSTIVAVGSDILINKIAAYLQGTNYVLGIIPVNASELVCQMIGTSQMEEACEALKFRRVKSVSLALVEPKKFLVSSAQITLDKAVKTIVNVDDIETELNITDATLLSPCVNNDSSISLFLKNKFEGPNSLVKGFNWLIGKKTVDNYSSILRGKSISLSTSEPMPLTVGSEIIAKTPIFCRVAPHALKIITRRAKIVQDANLEKK